jgi:DNA-binding response OmpR family regulator
VLDSDAEVVSVRTLEQARSALAADRFDLAVVDLALDGVSGLDLLPELRDVDGKTVPVIVYSAQGANRDCAAKVQAILAKSRASIDDLVVTLGRRLNGETPRAAEKRAHG